MTLLSDRDYYKPFQYPWAYEMYREQSRELFWKPETIDFSQDLQQFNELPDKEKEFLTKILTFFTQADIDISAHYIDNYLPTFSAPEIRMMLLSFANMESTHIDAYSKLVETLGIADYKSFLQYPSMKEKHEYYSNLCATNGMLVQDIMFDIAVGTAFGEGLQLFGTFAMLLSFPARGVLTGMRDVVQWSLRDETLHVEGLVKIFNTLKSEYPEMWTDSFKRTIYSACRDIVELEDRFISEVYADDLNLPNLDKSDIHLYIRYLADHRLGQLGLKPNYYQEENPIENIIGLFTNNLHEDFFNGTVTSYQHSNFDAGSMW